jgi:hypothetical protein
VPGSSRVRIVTAPEGRTHNGKVYLWKNTQWKGVPLEEHTMEKGTSGRIPNGKVYLWKNTQWKRVPLEEHNGKRYLWKNTHWKMYL